MFSPPPSSLPNPDSSQNHSNPHHPRKTKMTISGATHRFALQTLARSSHLLPLAFFMFTFCFLQISVASDDEATYEWEPDLYPNLNRAAKLCTGAHRNPPSSICDPDGILNKDEAILLDKMIARPSNSTACMCSPCPPNKKGLIIKVAILLAVKKRANQTMDETIEQFADRTRSNWNFSPKCNHDVIIFVQTSYNKVYLSMGSIAERVIGTSEAKEIVKQTSNHFRFGHIYQGLESIIASVKDREESYDPRIDRLGLKHGLMISIGAALLSLIVIIIAVWFCIQRETKRTNKIKGPEASREYHLVNSENTA